MKKMKESKKKRDDKIKGNAPCIMHNGAHARKDCPVNLPKKELTNVEASMQTFEEAFLDFDSNFNNCFHGRGFGGRI